MSRDAAALRELSDLIAIVRSEVGVMTPVGRVRRPLIEPPASPKPGRTIALPVGTLEGRLALAMAELQSAVAGQRAVAEALAGIVAEVSTKTQPADLRHLATGLASN
ncbi:MAG TPA: hypothetical protein VF989_07210, partial [Polyangiaceae bacterium]